MVQWALRAELLHGGPRTIGTFVEVLAPWESLRAVQTAPKRARRKATSMPKRRQKPCQKGGRERPLNKVGMPALSWSPSWSHFLPLWALGCPFWEPFGNPVAPGGTYNSSFWEPSRQKWLQIEILDSNGHGVADGIKSRAQRVWILRGWSLENRAPV